MEGVLEMVTEVASIREYRKRFPITWGIAVLLIGIMILGVLGKVIIGIESWIPFMGVSQEISVSEEPYRLVTYAFFHFSWLHLAVNVMAILVMGAWMESYLPRFWYLGLCLGGIVGGGLAVWGWQNGMSVGASGFGFALLGIGAMFFLWDRSIIEPPVQSFMMGLCIVGWPLTFFAPFVSTSGHVGGFAAGFIIGGLYLIIRRSYRKYDVR